MRKVNIKGDEYKLHCNLKAVEEIEKNGCKISEVNDWLVPEKGNLIGDFEKIAVLFVAMVNGAVYQHNLDVEYGVIDGEKKEYLTEEQVKKYEYAVKTMNTVEFIKLRNVISLEISDSFGFELPEGMEEEVDRDLADCPSEKND